MSARMYATMYLKHAPKQVFDHHINYSKIKATAKWVQHCVNLHIMQKLLVSASRDDRYTLLAAIKAAETKVNYYYKHPNFDLNEGLTLFKQAKRMLKNK